MFCSLIAMQRDDNKKKNTNFSRNNWRPPTEGDVTVSAGTTQLSKEELHHLFHDRNLAFVSTLSKDGSPHVTPVWTEMVDDLILINTFETSAKNKHITIDKRIALSIVEQSIQSIQYGVNKRKGNRTYNWRSRWASEKACQKISWNRKILLPKTNS